MTPQGHFGRNYYYWRSLTSEQQEQVLEMRKAQNRPWHSPPHDKGEGRFRISATCYEHAGVIGRHADVRSPKQVNGTKIEHKNNR